MKPIFNALEFDGIDSIQHSIFITGESVYDAPERDVETVEIAGRNGNVIIDNGRWKNIDVTYHAGTYGEDQAEFANKIRNFRNLLASRLGYHRLMDTYNPEEYRIGRFKSVEVEAEGRKRAGEFDLTFSCKPQRYLMSGETEQVVTSGEKLFNPTPYEASPLIITQGAGSMSISGQTISVEGSPVGEIDLTPLGGFEAVSNKVISMPDAVMLADSDELHVCFGVYLEFTAASGYTIGGIGEEETRDSGRQPVDISYNLNTSYKKATVTYLFNLSYHKGVDYTDNTETGLHLVVSGTTYDYTVQTTVAYDGEDTATISVNLVSLSSGTTVSNTVLGISQGRSYGISSISAATAAVIIDTEIGEAYIEESGQIIPINSKVVLGSKLPVLKTEENTITYTGFTSVKIRPRWWIL